MGLVFGGAYLRRETRVSKSIALALQLEVNLPFLLFYFVFEGNCPSTSSQGRGGLLYLEGRFNGGFFALPLWGAHIWMSLYMEGPTFGILRYVIYTKIMLRYFSVLCPATWSMNVNELEMTLL